MAPFDELVVKADSELPVYRQIAEKLTLYIQNGSVKPGERLPATRELAGQLGLNRATISAAYSLLEETGLIEGHVGRGSFVARRGSGPQTPSQPGWNNWFTTDIRRSAKAPSPVTINFASSRPDSSAFPLSSLRKLTKEVIDGSEAGEILQLGSSYGYAPLRRYLLETALNEGVARSSDAVLITNGCQQALDLLARVFASVEKTDGVVPGVVVEDPSYHGLLRIFARSGLPLFPVPVRDSGIDLVALEQTLIRNRPRVLIVTPSFQNPTGTTLSLSARKRLLELVSAYGLLLIENDIYSELRYEGEALPTLKKLDSSGNTILLRSYSKVAFPGLRVGWVVAPREVVTRLADEKQVADLHSDQLSQAILLQFVRSGELESHLERTRARGLERLRAALSSCERFLPPGSVWTRPEGGMSLWLQLPPPLMADQVLLRAQARGVDFLPGRHFASGPAHERSLRISFGGLAPSQIEKGIQILGEAAASEWAALQEHLRAEPAMALV